MAAQSPSAAACGPAGPTAQRRGRAPAARRQAGRLAIAALALGGLAPAALPHAFGAGAIGSRPPTQALHARPLVCARGGALALLARPEELAAAAASDLPGVDAGGPPLEILAVVLAVVAGALFVLLGSRAEKGYMTDGSVVGRWPLEGGGSLRVTSHLDAMQGAPPGAPQGSAQEWRVLRFEPCDMYLQAVTKVCVAPPGSPEPRVELLGQVLSLPYNQSLVAVVLATLAALGVPVEAAASGATGSKRRPRILCIGLGGGSVPSFFATALPGCLVDVVELEGTVVKAATAAMGFTERENLKVAVEDGAAFAERKADEAGEDGAYDAVVIDAFDSEGNVPQAMWSPGGGVAKALSKGLLGERGCVAVNFLPDTKVIPRLAVYRDAMAAAGRSRGIGFTVAAEEGNLMTVQTCGGPADAGLWLSQLGKAGRDVKAAAGCALDLEELATRELTVWD